MHDRLPLLGLLALMGISSACVRPTPSEATQEVRSFPGPGGETIQVPVPIRGLVPGNAAALDFISELWGPERVAAMPQLAAKYSNVSSESRAGWDSRPVLAAFDTEEFLSLKVDFVIAHDWQRADLEPTLNGAGMHSMFLPTVASFDDIVASFAWVGDALGESEAANKKVAALRNLRAELERNGMPLAEETALIYSNYGGGGKTSGAGTSYDLMIRLAGLKNAATEAGIKGHVDLDIEGLLAIQPGFLIVAGEGEGLSTSLESLRDSLQDAPVKAFQAGRILVIPPNQLTTTSHHLVYGAQTMQEQALRLRDAK